MKNQFVRFSFIVIIFQAVQNEQFFDYYDEEYDGDNIVEQIPIDRNANQLLTGDRIVPQIHFESQWPSPEVYNHLGKISALVPIDDSASTVLVLHRADRSWNKTTFDAQNRYQHKEQGPIPDGVLVRVVNGKFNGSYLQNTLYLPHGITVDHQGNVWITDVAMHQVFKFGPDLNQKPLLALGEAFVPGSDNNHFCKPTHVVVQRNGDFFVSDGYCNNRIMKFHSSGKLVGEWGRPNSDYTHPNDIFPGRYDFNLPHQMALAEEFGLLCVADRENRRVACYDTGVDGKDKHQLEFVFDEKFTEYGPVYGVAIAPKESLLFALVGEEHSGFPVAVHMISLGSLQTIGVIQPFNESFGYAHTISSCISKKQPGCLFICNLDSATPIHRRLWWYRFDNMP